MIFDRNNASKFPEIISFEYDHFFPFIFGDERNEMKKKKKLKAEKRSNKTKHLRINKCTFKKRNSMQSRTIWNTRTFSHFDLAELLRRKICITIPVKFTSSGQKLFKINQLC